MLSKRSAFPTILVLMTLGFSNTSNYIGEASPAYKNEDNVNFWSLGYLNNLDTLSNVKRVPHRTNSIGSLHEERTHATKKANTNIQQQFKRMTKSLILKFRVNKGRSRTIAHVRGNQPDNLV
ncbi:hypothetical protein MD535_05745 [Vibrio sp. ZSDZ65]|uniref:Uncharacterized protein n=1 Tax=Vibrio qingdaonensis TaxID=2829491 RepID=A0A9X3CLJ6_9VIBR|nr:hypothetical protein [Vibrio qingdaonensis]MCW8345520.1 hypothetical protein [Vibrio qingdaonensis]